MLTPSAEDVAPGTPLGLCTPGCSLWTLWRPHPQHQQAPLSEAQISRLRQQSRLASLQLPHAEADLAALQQVWSAGVLFFDSQVDRPCISHFSGAQGLAALQLPQIEAELAAWRHVGAASGLQLRTVV